MPNGIPKRKVAKLIADTESVVSAQELIHAWETSDGSSLTPTVIDSKFYAVPWMTWKLILQYSNVDAGTYKRERYDCDDFAVALRAAVSRKLGLNSVGLVFDISGRHAYSALLVTDPTRIVFLEPQNDRVVVKQHGTPYTMSQGFDIW